MGRVDHSRKLITLAFCISFLLLVYYRDYEELVDYRGLTESLDYASQRILRLESRLDITTSLPSQNTTNVLNKEPVESVFFLKTYKTGSSTLATIFSRYCFFHNRSMILTKQNLGSHLYPYGGEPAGLPFKPSVNGIIGWQKQSKQYDFVVNHMTYNFTFADDYLPTAKKISILRHPASLMTSTWKYYFNSLVTEKNVRDIFPTLKNDTTGRERVTSLYKILADPIVFYEKSMTVNGKGPAKWKRHLLRPQLFSFMGPEVLKMNLEKDVIRSYLARIQKHFDLILIMEYYDLGLALLSFELNWSPVEMAYLKMNGGREHQKHGKAYYEEQVRVINYPDFMLYEHFNRTFWGKVHQIGVDIVQQRADMIKIKSEELAHNCTDGFRSFRNWAGDAVMLPKLKKEMNDDVFCKLSTMQGNELSKVMVDRQNKLVRNWT